MFSIFTNYSLLIALAVVAVGAVWYFARRSARRALVDKLNFMSDALLSGEMSFKYIENETASHDVNHALNRLKGVFERRHSLFLEQERYLSLMLNHVQSGVMVIDADSNVDYCNAVALRMLGVMSLSNLRQVANLSSSLADSFAAVEEGSDVRAEYRTENGTTLFGISACRTTIRGKAVKIVTFNDITYQTEQNEAESWSRLIRVLTHEIMNTVTPIASISASLSERIDSYGRAEVRDALNTISASSNNLISFVDAYRSLTRIPAPVMKAFYVRQLAERVIRLANAEFPDVSITYAELADDIILYADEGLIYQILVNVVRNAVQASATEVSLTANINKRDSVTIDISNNGEPISEASSGQIFVPFFTTKHEGSGIGLSISRQIMRQHGGSLTLLASDEGRTVFRLTFR